MITASIIISTGYLFLIGSLTYGFNKLKTFHLKTLAPKNRFSVIIPFRNEAEHLPELLQSIKNLSYPKRLFEIIFVDDASEDLSVKMIKNQLLKSGISFRVVFNERKTNSPKKDAITTAISYAKYKWIVTTDADCVLPTHWLNCFDEFIQQTQTLCLAGPVAYSEEKSFLNRFQILDLLSLQGATLGGFGLKRPFLCNGANFAYNKDVFTSLNGFEGNNNIASGDDIFLLEKIAHQYPNQLHYLKNKQAIVTTKPQTTWNALCQQRIRWAAKTSNYNNGFGKLTGLIVLLMNIITVLVLVLTTIGMFEPKNGFYLITLKLIIDFALIYKTALFFNQQSILKRFIPVFFIYPFFSVFIAFTSLFSNYQWKGRKFKK